MSSAYPVILTFGGVDRYIQLTHAVWLKVEAKFGPIFELARRMSRFEVSLAEQTDLLAMLVPDVPIEQVHAHFDEYGHTTVSIELQSMLARGLGGWRELSEEVTAHADANPPQPTARKPRADRGKPRGPRKGSSPGAISSELQPSPASDQANSGASDLLTLQPSSALVVEPTAQVMNGVAMVEVHANDDFRQHQTTLLG